MKHTIKDVVGAGEIALWIKYLLNKHKGLRSIPSTHIKMMNLMVHICNPNFWQVETFRCLRPLASQPTILGKVSPSKTLCH